MDTFGDGWGAAQLHVFVKDRAEYSSYMLLSNPTTVTKCFDPMTDHDGDTMVASVQGFNVQQPWEVSI